MSLIIDKVLLSHCKVNYKLLRTMDKAVTIVWNYQDVKFNINSKHTAWELKNRCLFLLNNAGKKKYCAVVHFKNGTSIVLKDDAILQEHLSDSQYISIDCISSLPDSLLIKQWRRITDDSETTESTSESTIAFVDSENVIKPGCTSEDLVMRLQIAFGENTKIHLVCSVHVEKKIFENFNNHLPNVIKTSVPLLLKDTQRLENKNLDDEKKKAVLDILNKEAADKEILKLIAQYAADSKDWKPVLVSGDNGFLPAVYNLNRRDGIPIFLIHKDFTSDLTQSWSSWACFIDEVWKVPIYEGHLNNDCHYK